MIKRDLLFESLFETSGIMFPDLTIGERTRKTLKLFYPMANKLCEPESISTLSRICDFKDDMTGDEAIFRNCREWKKIMKRRLGGNVKLMYKHARFIKGWAV